MKKILLSFLFILLASNAMAGVYATTAGNAGTMLEDAELNEGTKTVKRGGNTTALIGEGFLSSQIHLWIDCPSAVDSIPAGATIDSLIILMKITGGFDNDNDFIEVDFWSVSQVVVEADVTWNKYDATNNWISGGGDGTSVQATGLKVIQIGGPFPATDSVSVLQDYDGNTFNDTIPDNTVEKVAFHMSVALAQDVYDRTSNGLFLRNNPNTPSNINLIFATSENATSADRPIWTWYYTEGGLGDADYITDTITADDAIDDGYLRQNSPTQVNGSLDNITMGEVAGPNGYNGIFFDSSAKNHLGPFKTVDSLEVRIKIDSELGGVNDTTYIDLYVVDEVWSEANISWNNRLSGTPWAFAGGKAHLFKTDYAWFTFPHNDTVVFFTDLGGTDTMTTREIWSGGNYLSIPIPKAIAQTIYELKAYGFLFHTNTTKSDQFTWKFISVESATSINRPIWSWWVQPATDSSINRLHDGKRHSPTYTTKLHGR